MFGQAARRGDRCFRAVTDRDHGRVAVAAPDRLRTQQQNVDKDSPTCLLAQAWRRRRRPKTEQSGAERRRNMHRGRRLRAPRAPSTSLSFDRARGLAYALDTHNNAAIVSFLKSTRIPTQRRCDAAPCQHARARLLCSCSGSGVKTGRRCLETRAAAMRGLGCSNGSIL